MIYLVIACSATAIDLLCLQLPTRSRVRSAPCHSGNADLRAHCLPVHTQNATDEGAPKARPWERSDLVRRLRSFRPATWFCKPAPAGPIECGASRLGQCRPGPAVMRGAYNLPSAVGCSTHLALSGEALDCIFTAPAPASPAPVACTNTCSL